MYFRIIINFILLLALVLIQISFISGLPLGLNNLNIIIISLIFTLGFKSINQALWSAVTLGFFLDIFSFSFFGLHLIVLTLTISAVHFLLNNFFTNRSLYSMLALVSLAMIIYELCLNSFIYLAGLFSNMDLMVIGSDFWYVKLIQLGINLLAVIIIFYLIHFIANRLSPVFLLKKTN